MRRMRAAAAALLLAAGAAAAAPRTPEADSEILERLPVRGASERAAERMVRAALASNPRDVETAVRLASLHVDRARVEADPRHLGRAQAALAPWWNEAQPPTPVLGLRARIFQANHRFPESIADLRRLAARDPSDPQVWLMLATVQQVSGDLAGSRSSCGELRARTIAIVTAACFAAADGEAGDARAAADALDASLRSAAAPAHLRAWALGVGAELAERMGDRPRAERLYRQSLAIDADDAYMVGAFADFLLSEGRPAEAAALIPRDAPSDPLLVRRAIALKRAGDAGFAEVDSVVRRRFDAARARGDTAHRREEARYALDIDRDAARALVLARANWEVQKEPADALLVVLAAAEAGSGAVADEVRAWMAANVFRDARIARLLQAEARR